MRRFTSKVSDFGLSRLLPEHSPKLGSNAEYTGTITHMAPELLQHGAMSRAADVYSFGILSKLAELHFLITWHILSYSLASIAVVEFHRSLS